MIRTAKSTPDKVRLATNLSRNICRGWLATRKLVNEQLHACWHYRRKLSVESGLVFKVDWLVVPETPRAAFIKELHEEHVHFREEKTLPNACNVFWPSITNDIRAYTKACNNCQAIR